MLERPLKTLVQGAADIDCAATPDVRIRRWRYDGPTRLWPRGSHAQLEVAWVTSGALHYGMGPREIEVAADAMMVLPSGIEHATRMSSGMRAGSVWLSESMLCEIGEVMGTGLVMTPTIVPMAPQLVRLGKLLQTEATRQDAGSGLVIDALSDAFAVELLRHCGARERTPAYDRRIRLAVQCMQDRYADRFTVEDLARLAGMSRYHFSRVFAEQMGVSPYRFLLNTRLERAAELLRSGRQSVTAVALTVGFRDLGRFSRAFRQRFGCPPREMVRRRAQLAVRSVRST